MEMKMEIEIAAVAHKLGKANQCCNLRLQHANCERQEKSHSSGRKLFTSPAAVRRRWHGAARLTLIVNNNNNKRRRSRQAGKPQLRHAQNFLRKTWKTTFPFDGRHMADSLTGLTAQDSTKQGPYRTNTDLSIRLL